jgi:hypothetical protein
MSERAKRALPCVLAAFLLVATGCQSPQAWGEANSIIVAMEGEEWERIGTEVEDALEPRIFTVRDERMFEVTPADPRDQRWRRFREFRRMLMVGSPEDDWIQPALRRVSGDIPDPPAVVRARNVWARGQEITIALVPPEEGAEAVRPMLDQIGEQYRTEFTQWARQRMYTSGVDTALAGRLEREAGFSLTLPEVYRGGQMQPDGYLFRNDHPEASRLTRSILVTWREGAEAGAMGEGDALAWRTEAAERFYDPPHVTETDRIESAPVEADGERALQIQGVWASPEGAWPAAGPFVSRVVSCPAQDRVYLLDAWLYAPGRPKHEFMIQLGTILDTFRCGG